MTKRGYRSAFVAGTVVAAGLVACAGHSQALGQDGGVSQIDCLTSLQSYCCGGSEPAPCVATFAEAEECGSWSAGTKLGVYATPCLGLTAIRVTQVGYAMLYVYDATGALYAVGDNAAADNPSSTVVECGAGPQKYVIPAECAQAWIGGSPAACTAGTVTPGSVCQ
jgi:hypothetical protein